MNQEKIIGMVIFQGLTQLDFTGPYEVLSRIPNIKVLVLAENINQVKSEQGLCILPDTSFANCPKLEVLFVPGGPGITQQLQNSSFLQFLSTQGKKAKWVTSVCTGSILLAAAGLLNGYKATTHWLSLDLLALWKDVTVIRDNRVVVDRNRITGAGVTAGIDFALVLAAEISGKQASQLIQLFIQYDPQPPFNSGSPTVATKELVQTIVNNPGIINRQKEREEIIKHFGKAFRNRQSSRLIL